MIPEFEIHTNKTFAIQLNLDYMHSKLLRNINNIFYCNCAADLPFHTAKFRACFLVGIFVWVASWTPSQWKAILKILIWRKSIPEKLLRFTSLLVKEAKSLKVTNMTKTHTKPFSAKNLYSRKLYSKVSAAMASAKKTKTREAWLLCNKYLFCSQLCCFKTTLIQWTSNVSWHILVQQGGGRAKRNAER